MALEPFQEGYLGRVDAPDGESGTGHQGAAMDLMVSGRLARLRPLGLDNATDLP